MQRFLRVSAAKIRILKEWRSFAVALQLLTRLPAPQIIDFNPRVLDHSVKYFPLVGIVVGALSGLALYAASFFFQGALPALIGVAVGIVLTGALHEDGLGDFFDAMGAMTRAQRLHIMKDSRIGANGALALILSQAMKVAALAALPPGVAAFALIAAHAGGRLATICVMALLSYTGESGAAKIRPLSGRISRTTFAVASAMALLPLLALPLVGSGASLLVAGLAAGLLALLAFRKLGGYTGDVLGAVEQGFEIGFVLGMAASV